MRRQRVACVFAPASGGALATVAELSALAEACYRFSPQIALRPGEAIFIEIGGSRGLFREETIPLRISALAKRFGLSPRVAIADDAPTALALARFRVAQASQLPIEALSDYASPFDRNPDAIREAEKLAATMRALGIGTLSEFAKLPPGTLASRFGRNGVEVSRRIRAGYARPWPLYRLPEKISEKAEFGGEDTLSAVSTLEPLVFTLRGLVDRAMARLRARSLRAAVIGLELRLERGHPPRHWVVDLPLPQGGTKGLLPILSERLAFDLAMRPLPTGVSAIRFTVLETAPGHGAQRDFFSRREEEAEAWDALLARLTEKLGRNRAFVAAPVDRYLPEGAWEPRLSGWQCAEEEAVHSAGALGHPPRPSRLLKKPEPLRRIGDLLVHCTRGRRWKITEWHGPERISGEWWQLAFSRDYYRVVTETGEQLWVYATPKEESVFCYLHGYFD